MGQAATEVTSLYFISRGTLDVALWGRIEEKFTNVRQFVDGREDDSAVVNETCYSESQLFDDESSSCNGTERSNRIVADLDESEWREILEEHVE
jgi:hypothetical protein